MQFSAGSDGSKEFGFVTPLECHETNFLTSMSIGINSESDTGLGRVGDPGLTSDLYNCSVSAALSCAGGCGVRFGV